MPIDLEASTVTRPSQAMRHAMATAKWATTSWGTTRPWLPRGIGAALAGFEAALFVPSGTMASRIAIAVHTKPGTRSSSRGEIHVAQHEMGAMAALSGTMPRIVGSARGIPSPDAVALAARPDASYFPRTALLCLENTHNGVGGAVMDLAAKDALLAVAARHRMAVHLDGARIWNAAAALGATGLELARGFASVMFCLSKGLGAPVGSLLLSDRAFISEARRARKRFGGGMRQAGILAAAGLLALENRDRLVEDHRRARLLAEGISPLPRLEVTYGGTNIVMVDVTGAGLTPTGAAEGLARRGVLALPFDETHVRLVTHLDVSDADVERAIAVFVDLLAA
ncbi:MAG: GntG family PLP-dependent aldolase [Acidobacteriota bacterium]